MSVMRHWLLTGRERYEGLLVTRYESRRAAGEATERVGNQGDACSAGVGAYAAQGLITCQGSCSTVAGPPGM